jgi:ribosomal-protein-alanine N-acetyltransferase
MAAAEATGRAGGGFRLETRRLRLRELQLKDARPLLELDGSERVRALLLDDHVGNLDQSLALIAWARRFGSECPGLGLWACEETRAQQGRFVGVFSLMPLRDGSGDVEIGVRLLPPHWGRGYPLEMGRALCSHAFEELQLPRLVGLFDEQNRGARLALQRLGFVAAGRTLHFGKPALRYVLVKP